MSRYIVIDTNIPLTDANAILTLGAEPDTVVIIPETVLAELDNKKTGFGPTMVGEWGQAHTDCTPFLNNVS